MAFQYITTTEPITAYGNAKFPDTKNRNGKLLVNAFLKEHDITGIHTLPLLQVYQATYEGTNTAQTISLANSLANIKLLFIFSESYSGVYIVSDISTINQIKSTALSDNLLGAYLTLPQGAFTFTSASIDHIPKLNANGITYYYAALSTGAVDDSGDNSDPPTWVEHGDDLKGGAGFAGNQVEEKLYSYFTVGHNDNGTHKRAALTGKSLIETGSFVCDGTALQEIPLAQPALYIKALFIWHPTMQQPIYVQTATMAKLRGLTATVLPNTGYVTLAKGEFHIDGTKLEAETQLLGIYSDTYDGDPNIVDSSEYQTTIRTTFDVSNSLIAHSTDTYYSSASSIKLNMGSQRQGFFDVPMNTLCLNQETCWMISFAMNTTDIQPFFAAIVFYNNILNILLYFTLCMSPEGRFSVLCDQCQIYYQSAVPSFNLKDGNWHKIEIKKIARQTPFYISFLIDNTEVAFTAFARPMKLLNFQIESGYYAISPTVMYIDDIEIFATSPVFQQGETYYYAAIGDYAP